MEQAEATQEDTAAAAESAMLRSILETVPDAMGSGRSSSGHPFQRLHDGEAGMAELGPADCVAGHRTGCLLYLQREAQPGTTRRGESKSRGVVHS